MSKLIRSTDTMCSASQCQWIQCDLTNSDFSISPLLSLSTNP